MMNKGQNKGHSTAMVTTEEGSQCINPLKANINLNLHVPNTPKPEGVHQKKALWTTGSYSSDMWSVRLPQMGWMKGVARPGR